MPTTGKLFQPSTNPEPQLYHVDHDMAVGSGSNVLVIAWRDRTTLSGVELCNAYFQAACRGQGNIFALVTIVENGAKLPEARERKRLAELLSDSSDWLQVSTLVFEGSGFLAATIRGVVTGIALMANHSFPHRVFESISEAARFIVREQRPNNSAPFVVGGVEAVVSGLRRQIAAHRFA